MKFQISDGNATEEINNFEDAVEVAENWYDYMDVDDSVVKIADYSDANDVAELNSAIRVFENQLAESFEYGAFHGHGSYSVDAASQAGYNLTVSCID